MFYAATLLLAGVAIIVSYFLLRKHYVYILEQMFSYSKSFFILTNKKGKILYVNDHFVDFIKINRRHMVGSYIQSFNYFSNKFIGEDESFIINYIGEDDKPINTSWVKKDYVKLKKLNRIAYVGSVVLKVPENTNLYNVLTLLNNSPVAIGIFDKENVYFYNKRLHELINMDKSSETDLFKIFMPNDTFSFDAYLTDVIDNDNIRANKMSKLLALNGEVIDVEATTIPWTFQNTKCALVMFQKRDAAIISGNKEYSTQLIKKMKLLSNREKEILAKVYLGFTSQKIADMFKLSINTVNNHRRNIIKKLEVDTISDLITTLNGREDELKFLFETKDTGHITKKAVVKYLMI